MSVMASQIISNSIDSLFNRLLGANIKETSKSILPALCEGKSTGDRWIPHYKRASNVEAFPWHYVAMKSINTRSSSDY